MTKNELIQALRGEVRLILHLISKIDPARLDYRPTPTQRSTLELVQYLAIMAPVHLGAVLADAFDMGAWREAWNRGEREAKQMGLEEAKEAIAGQAGLAAELLGGYPDERLGEETEMFGIRASRGALAVNLVLCHYAAYRMQLFLYLKSSGREELNTLNLWAGIDGKL